MKVNAKANGNAEREWALTVVFRQDAEAKGPVHHAIMNQHAVIISLLMSHPRLDLTLKDIQGLSPFAIAMTTKNNKAAQAILDREPTACEQVLIAPYASSIF